MQVGPTFEGVSDGDDLPAHKVSRATLGEVGITWAAVVWWSLRVSDPVLVTPAVLVGFVLVLFFDLDSNSSRWGHERVLWAEADSPAHSPASYLRGPGGKNPLVLRLGHSADSDRLAVERVGTGWSGGPVRMTRIASGLVRTNRTNWRRQFSAKCRPPPFAAEPHVVNTPRPPALTGSSRPLGASPQIAPKGQLGCQTTRMFHAPFSAMRRIHAGLPLGATQRTPRKFKKAWFATDSPRAQYVSLSRVSCVSGGIVRKPKFVKFFVFNTPAVVRIPPSPPT